MNSGRVQTWELVSGLSAAAEARGHVADACAELPEDTVYTARLLVTELVSNAVLHGQGQVVLTVAREQSGVRVEVHDDSARLPTVTDGPALAEHGAGLRLVAALASSWGSSPRGGGRPGKRVWFTLQGR